jgi:Large ribosomal RNA subunit accumulation protein YceD
MGGDGFSHSVRVERIPPGGRHVRIEADESERHKIAEALGVVGVAALTAEFDLRRLGADIFGVRGTLSAAVDQTDIVTLEPVRQEVAETIDLTLAPAEGPRQGNAPGAAGGEPTEERDLYRNGEIDLGAIAQEHLALGLDPYPRAPGVAFSGHVEDESGPEESPFAVLERLKRDQE